MCVVVNAVVSFRLCRNKKDEEKEESKNQSVHLHHHHHHHHHHYVLRQEQPPSYRYDLVVHIAHLQREIHIDQPFGT